MKRQMHNNPFQLKWIVLAIWAMGYSYQGVAQSQSLAGYLALAVENNPGLNARYLTFEAAMQSAAQVSALPDPKLTFGMFISPVETRVGPQRFRANITQMFPWFGALKARGQVQSVLAEAKYQEFLMARNELFFQVKTTWYDLFELEKKLDLESKNLRLLEELKILATNRYQSGLGKLSDPLRVDLQLENSRTVINLLKDKRKPLLARFNVLLNRTLNSAVTLPDSLPDILPETLSLVFPDSIGSKHPLFRSWELQKEAMELRKEVVRTSGMPAFGLGLDYAMVTPRQDLEVAGNGRDVIMPMVSLSIPVFRKKIEAGIIEAELRKEAFTANQDQLLNKLRSQFEMAVYMLSQSHQNLELSRRLIGTTIQIRDLLISDYSSSGKGFEEVLRQQQSILKYRKSEVKSLTESYQALSKIELIISKSE